MRNSMYTMSVAIVIAELVMALSSGRGEPELSMNLFQR
jgi:hypothetical protein